MDVETKNETKKAVTIILNKLEDRLKVMVEEVVTAATLEIESVVAAALGEVERGCAKAKAAERAIVAAGFVQG